MVDVGIDLAKNAFALHGVADRGEILVDELGVILPRVEYLHVS